MNEEVAERRHARRWPADEHGIASARIWLGHVADVVDVSSGGALIETDWRLLPGAAVELHLESTEGRIAIRGRVLRSAVVRLRSNSVSYRGAIAFDRSLPWFVEQSRPGYAVPSSESRPGRHRRADATPQLS